VVSGGTYNESIATFTDFISVSCLNCGPELTSLGAFTKLAISCTNCTALTTLGSFPVLTSIVGLSYGDTSSNLTLSCTNCPVLTTLGSFPVLATILGLLAVDLPTGTLSLSCTNCTALTTLGSFGDLATLVVITGTGVVAVGCTNCPNLNSLGSFNSLATEDPQLDPNKREKIFARCQRVNALAALWVCLW